MEDDNDAKYTAEDIERIKNIVLTTIDSQFDDRPADGIVHREDVKESVRGAFDPYNV